MALISRRDAIVFHHPPLVKHVNGVKYTKFADHHYVDEETGGLVYLEAGSWWTDADMQERGLPPEGLQLSPPEPGGIYYEGPVWPEDPERTKAAVREFVAALPIPESSTIYITTAKSD